MNWDAIGAIGDLLGALAVVLTFMYLSTQIRQSNQATKSASIRDAATGINELNGWPVTDESLARIFRIGMSTYEALTDDQAVRFSMLMLGAFHVFETLFLQDETGAIDPGLWEAETRSLQALVAQPGCAH